MKNKANPDLIIFNIVCQNDKVENMEKVGFGWVLNHKNGFEIILDNINIQNQCDNSKKIQARLMAYCL